MYRSYKLQQDAVRKENSLRLAYRVDRIANREYFGDRQAIKNYCFEWFPGRAHPIKLSLKR